MEKKRLFIMFVFIIGFLVAIILSFIYYNNKYSVYFETGTNEIFLTRYVKKNEKIIKPSDPVKEGYIFKGWQLNGKPYNFDTKIKQNIVLTAKWVKEEYVIINFNSNDFIESQKILKGESIDELPLSSKEGFEFIGWYLNDGLYDDEKIYDDITLYAKYKNNIINTSYKVGDIVTIIGKYSASAFSKVSIYDKAIGWNREILYIINDSTNPYVVGNKQGVTGFFKASSIERVE